MGPGDGAGEMSTLASSSLSSRLKLGKDIWLILRPESVHEGVDDDEKEGHDEVEDEPDVDHLDIGRVGQVRVDLATSLRKYRSGDFTWTKRATSTSIAVRLIAMIDSK